MNIKLALISLAFVCAGCDKATSPPATLLHPALTTDVCERFGKGNTAIENRQFEDAFKLFQPLANAGYSHAQLKMGELYMNGDLATGQDKAQARRWFRAAASQNNREAYFQLAEILRQDGQAPDPPLIYSSKVFDLYANAAALGHPEALAKYGMAMVLSLDNRPVDRRVVSQVYCDLKQAEAYGKDVRTALTAIEDQLSLQQRKTLENEAAQYLLSYETGCDGGAMFFGDRDLRDMCVAHNYITTMVDSCDTSCYKESVGPTLTFGDIMRARTQAFGAPHIMLTNSKYAGETGSVSFDALSLWRLVRPGDLVALSDRVTHHLMTVFAVRRGERKILLLDGWPENVFLLAGRNGAGIRAELVVAGVRLIGTIRKVKLVQISEAEFEEIIVSVGTVTSTREAYENYSKRRVEGK